MPDTEAMAEALAALPSPGCVRLRGFPTFGPGAVLLPEVNAMGCYLVSRPHRTVTRLEPKTWLPKEEFTRRYIAQARSFCPACAAAVEAARVVAAAQEGRL